MFHDLNVYDYKECGRSVQSDLEITRKNMGIALDSVV